LFRTQRKTTKTIYQLIVLFNTIINTDEIILLFKDIVDLKFQLFLVLNHVLNDLLVILNIVLKYLLVRLHHVRIKRLAELVIAFYLVWQIAANILQKFHQFILLIILRTYFCFDLLRNLLQLETKVLVKLDNTDQQIIECFALIISFFNILFHALYDLLVHSLEFLSISTWQTFLFLNIHWQHNKRLDLVTIETKPVLLSRLYFGDQWYLAYQLVVFKIEHSNEHFLFVKWDLNFLVPFETVMGDSFELEQLVVFVLDFYPDIRIDGTTWLIK